MRPHVARGRVVGVKMGVTRSRRSRDRMRGVGEGVTRSRGSRDRVPGNCAKRMTPAPFQRNSLSPFGVMCNPCDAIASLTRSRGIDIVQVTRSHVACDRVGQFVQNAQGPHDSSLTFWTLDVDTDL